MVFLGTLTKLQKANMNFVMSVCPSVRPHGTTRVPLDRFSCNLTYEFLIYLLYIYFFLICGEKSSALKSDKNNGYSAETTAVKLTS